MSGLKKNMRAMNFSTSDLRTMVAFHPAISLRRQCELLDLSWSSFNYTALEPGIEYRERLFELRTAIDKLWLEHPYFGVESMRLHLNEAGLGPVNHKLIRRLMREMGLMSVAPGPQTSMPHPAHKKWPYLLRDLKIEHADQVWCTDITYLPMRKGKFYLCAIMDWHTRLVLSWRISNVMDTPFCLAALHEAVKKYGKPRIMNTDQGSQYTADDWVNYLLGEDIKISMDGKGRAIDNVMIERLWRSYKYEYLYLSYPGSGEELQKGTADWMRYYNNSRLHTSLGGKTPIAFYKECDSVRRDA